ncbi:antitermination protein NusB [Dyella acidiphila]|nr:antitermination protein NusB [Dyella acidiphila]
MLVESFSMLAQGHAPWFVGWGTLALINAGLAQGKNRSGLVWFLLSVLFGPLATLVLVLMPKVRGRIF